MLGIVGTVPDPAFPLVHGPVALAGGRLAIGGQQVPVSRGTPALLAAAVTAAKGIGGAGIYAFLAGDIGKGDGSRRLYRFLVEHLPEFDLETLTFHYLLPDVDWHNRVFFAVEKMKRRPILIADAGYMYAAKTSGLAPDYDVFTPDVGELAFLADEQAPHPFYTRGFILHQDNQVPDLIQRAYRHRNAAVHLLVKGKTDYIVQQGAMLHTVDEPSSPAMEAIGGTGDTVTGILTALCGAGFSPAEGALLAARANRFAGDYTRPDPATQVGKLIDQIPQALSRVLGGSGAPGKPPPL